MRFVLCFAVAAGLLPYLAFVASQGRPEAIDYFLPVPVAALAAGALIPRLRQAAQDVDHPRVASLSVGVVALSHAGVLVAIIVNALARVDAREIEWPALDTWADAGLPLGALLLSIVVTSPLGLIAGLVGAWWERAEEVESA